MRRGFSLLELMVSVAIVGVLAAIAVPNFRELQHVAKRAEVPSNVNGIHHSELLYDAAFDEFLSAGSNPPGSPGKDGRAWDFGVSGWRDLGWSPEGDVRGVYEVVATGAAFEVVGACDVDGDGVRATYTAVRERNATLTAGDERVY
ncbi:MAG: type IV pilin protein [Myxococcota bacterium]